MWSIETREAFAAFAAVMVEEMESRRLMSATNPAAEPPADRASILPYIEQDNVYRIRQADGGARLMEEEGIFYFIKA